MAVFCDLALCGSHMNRRIEITRRLHLQGRKNNESEDKCRRLLTEYSSEALNEDLGKGNLAVGR